MLVNIECFAYGGSVRILATYLYGNLGAGGTVEPRGMYANLHRHHRVGIGGDSGSLLLLISVPGSIACTTGDERDGHVTGDHQIAALGRHLAMANLGLACRGNGRQGNIAHGDGLVHGWCRA